MPVVSKDQAIDLLTREVEKNLKADELAEVYGEVFPDSPPAGASAVKPLVDHLHGQREIEEIVDLWNLIFPKHRKVWYDEEEQRLHFNEESEPLHAD